METDIYSMSVTELGEHIENLIERHQQAAKTRERKDIRLEYEEAAREYNERINFKAFKSTL